MKNANSKTWIVQLLGPETPEGVRYYTEKKGMLAHTKLRKKATPLTWLQASTVMANAFYPNPKIIPLDPKDPVPVVPMFKTLYDHADLRCNQVGLDLKQAAEYWFEKMMDTYPDHNPREMVELFVSSFSIQASRRILDRRDRR